MKSILVVLIFSITANADLFSGYKQTDKAAYQEFEDAVHQITESSSEFYIMFDHRAAFYTFPKDPKAAKMLSDFLEKCRLSHTSIKVEINPFTAEIYRLSTN